MTTLAKDRTTKRLELFAISSLDFAERVEAGELDLRDAVDVLYDAAVSSGLVAATGDDAVQAVLAGAFANVQRRS